MDTNVLSVLAPSRSPSRRIERSAAEWITSHSEQLFLSAITIVELETGVRQLGRKSPGRFHEQLSSWFLSLLEIYTERILPLDLASARIAAELADRAVAIGRHPGTPDVLIAATAVAHGATLVTRNVRHFEPLGITAMNPFPAPPDSPS